MQTEKTKLQNTFLALLFLLVFQSTGFAQFKVIGYLPNWMNPVNTINNVDLSKLTQINLAFANPNSSGVLIPSDGVTNANVTTVVNACHAKGVKIFMSIGGAGAPATRYHNLLSNTTNMNNFVANIVSYATTYNLDGIDVDIEGDVLNGSYVTAAQYEAFVLTLDTALHAQKKEMSAALADWFGDYVTTKAATTFDWISIMSYDAAIPPSDPVGQHAPYSMVVDNYQYWNGTKGVPANQIVIGLPAYGYGWGTYATAGNNEIAYCDIVTTYPGAENNDQVGSGNNVIYYNGIPTIVKKTDFALQNASGVMIWEIAEDCPTSNSASLLLAISKTVDSSVVTGIASSQLSGIQMNVYPNPVTDKALVKLNMQESYNGSLILCDMSGRVLSVLAQGAISNHGQYPFSTSELAPGMYVLKLLTDKGTFVQKIAK